MVMTTEIGATYASSLPRTTTGVRRDDQGIAMPAGRRTVQLGSWSAGYDAVCVDAFGVKGSGLPSFATPLGSPAWSPPS